MTLGNSKARARGWTSQFVFVAAVILTFVVGAFDRAARADPPAPVPAPVVGSGSSPLAPQELGAPVVEARSLDSRPVFSLTISPLHLFLPVVELTGEYRALDKLGVALVAGAGKYTSDSGNISAGVLEAGAQLRYYVVGDFRHGMQLGAEVLYLHLTDDQVTATGEGVAMGPFAGYKIATRVGFTFEGQLGVEYVAARAEARNGAVTASDTNAAWIPLLNLNVGWSF